MAQLICLVYSCDITNVLLIHNKGTSHEWFFKWANWFVMTLQCLNNRVHYSETTKTSSTLVAGYLKTPAHEAHEVFLKNECKKTQKNNNYEIKIF